MKWALDDFGERQIAPAPEFRCRGTGHARDGRRALIVTDGELIPLRLAQWCGAIGAGSAADKQLAGVRTFNAFRFLQFGVDAFAQPRLIRATQRGDGDFLLAGINGDRFERGFFNKHGSDSACQTLARPSIGEFLGW